MKKLYVAGGLLVVIVIFIIFTRGNDTDDAVSITESNNISDVSSLSIAPQMVVKSVLIDTVDLKNPGYVLIREVYKGKLSQIVEVSELLPKGITENIQIELLEIPRDDVSLLAVIYEENEDGGFNPMTDIRIDESAVYVETNEKVPRSLFDSVGISLDLVEPSATVMYSGTTYTPATVTVEKGQTVSFVNNSDILMWVASDPHPAHTVLSSFDQFTGSEPGTTYQYTFDEIGTWLYHDHINPGNVGAVIVTEATAPVIPEIDRNRSGYYDTDVEIFADLAENPEVTMINVHVPFYGEIPGTDASIPYNKTEALLAALPENKNAPIALYCQGGGMSAAAARDVVAAGYTNVYDLTGGMVAYKRSGRDLLSSPSE